MHQRRPTARARFYLVRPIQRVLPAEKPQNKAERPREKHRTPNIQHRTPK